MEVIIVSTISSASAYFYIFSYVSIYTNYCKNVSYSITIFIHFLCYCNYSIYPLKFLRPLLWTICDCRCSAGKIYKSKLLYESIGITWINGYKCISFISSLFLYLQSRRKNILIMTNTLSTLVMHSYGITGHPYVHTRKNQYQCKSANMLLVLFSLYILIHTGKFSNKCMLCVVLTCITMRQSYISLDQYTHTGEKTKKSNRCRNYFLIIYNTPYDRKCAYNIYDLTNISKSLNKCIILILLVRLFCRTICGCMGIFIAPIQTTKWN